MRMGSFSRCQLLCWLTLLQWLTMAAALTCYQCGQYNEGVGSITPCLNSSVQLHLNKCPQHQSQYCIKYVTELSTVRDCVSTCVEKESWGSRTYCCATDECNSADMMTTRDVWQFLTAALLAQFTIVRAIFY